MCRGAATLAAHWYFGCGHGRTPQWFERGNRYAQNTARLEQFLALPRVDLILPDQETAFAYSRVNAHSRETWATDSDQ